MSLAKPFPDAMHAMVEIHRLYGQEIRIEIIEVAASRFRWTSLIEGHRPLKGQCTLPSFAIARSEALLYAQIAAKRMADGVATNG